MLRTCGAMSDVDNTDRSSAIPVPRTNPMGSPMALLAAPTVLDQRRCASSHPIQRSNFALEIPWEILDVNSIRTMVLRSKFLSVSETRANSNAKYVFARSCEVQPQPNTITGNILIV